MSSLRDLSVAKEEILTGAEVEKKKMQKRGRFIWTISPVLNRFLKAEYVKDATSD